MGFMADRREEDRPIPYFRPTLLFTEEEVKAIDWDKVFEAWDKLDAEDYKKID